MSGVLRCRMTLLRISKFSVYSGGSRDSGENDKRGCASGFTVLTPQFAGSAMTELRTACQATQKSVRKGIHRV
jgi:hypothetical protein